MSRLHPLPIPNPAEGGKLPAYNPEELFQDLMCGKLTDTNMLLASVPQWTALLWVTKPHFYAAGNLKRTKNVLAHLLSAMLSAPDCPTVSAGTVD